jgi:hypothetical protein
MQIDIVGEDLTRLTKLIEMTNAKPEWVIHASLMLFEKQQERVDELHRMFPKKMPDYETIDLNWWGCCTSTTCQLKSECAQHTTAGDFRDEDGVQPMLVRTTEDTRQIGCCTYHDSERFMGSGFIEKRIIENTDVGHIIRP